MSNLPVIEQADAQAVVLRDRMLNDLKGVAADGGLRIALSPLQLADETLSRLIALLDEAGVKAYVKGGLLHYETK